MPDLSKEFDESNCSNSNFGLVLFEVVVYVALILGVVAMACAPYIPF
jgi:hypothetical protein